MKRRIVGLTLAVTLMLSACGGSSKVIEGNVETTNNQAENQVQADETTLQEGVQEYKGYTFVYNDVVIEVDADASQVIEKLGEPDSYFEFASCAFEGLDKVYTYGSFEIDTYPMEEKDFISAVIFKDDVITTLEGVGIGDSIEKIKEIYGDETEEKDGMLVYEKDGMKLCFVIKDNAVASVEYCSTVLEEN